MDSTAIGVLVGGIIGIVTGIAIIIRPRILAWIVGLWLIIGGIIGVITAVT
jgi:uncharacterized membrane protein HdeD (DUF308 family)